MENRKEMILPTESAAIIQKEAQNHECVIIELGLIGNGNARVTVAGSPEKIDELLQLVKPKYSTNNEVVEMYANGLAIEDIAEELALSETEVFEILTQAGEIPE